MTMADYDICDCGICGIHSKCRESHPTIKIAVDGKEFNLPRPETQAPPVGTEYWLFNLVLMGTVSCTWDNDPGDRRRLEQGNVQLTEDRAKAWIMWWKEMIKIMKEQP